MSPVSQQGSRAGLISTVVVFAILFVVATVVAFYYNAEMRRSQEDIQSYRARYADIITDVALSGQDVTDLKTLRSDPASGFNAQMKVLDVALEQRNQLAKLVTGTSSTAAEAVSQAKSRLGDAAEKLKSGKTDVLIPSVADNLGGAVVVLAEAVATKQNQIQTLQNEVKKAKEEVAAALAAKAKELTAKDEAVKEVREQTAKELAAATADRSAKQSQVEEIQKKADEDRKAAQEALAKKEVDLAAKEAELKKKQDELEKTNLRFARIRVKVDEAAVRRAAGTISRIAPGNIVFINRGRGDQLVAGMTFTVYDKNEGIPSLGDGMSNDSLPAGKGSVEVIRVGASVSECRIIKLRPGMAFSEGDPIVNLVYDPNTKYNFMVYGTFDLDHNKQFTAQEAEALRRLVTQWGGRSVDKVDVDTDFVVLGKEPELPTFSAEELQVPLNKKTLDDAKAELDAYNEIRQRARELHIPVMNQNRFLYFIGYYDVAGR